MRSNLSFVVRLDSMTCENLTVACATSPISAAEACNSQRSHMCLGELPHWSSSSILIQHTLIDLTKPKLLLFKATF